MTPAELVEILKKYRLWVEGKTGGQRANLANQALSGLKLPGINLTQATLSGSDLNHSVLEGANLSGADLFATDFRHADLSGANLSQADMRGAQFFGADLSGANLDEVDLRSGTPMHAKALPNHPSQARLAGSGGSVE
ncbi:MAG TPA: pentapeptide repeat-containing protein, partial [Alphaproteobacteria bacterium]|nr:pentapeptide repeat-containing protein [Alphaproteobacteria bacterium]